MFDLRSDLMVPRSPNVVAAMQAAATHPPTMTRGEDASERLLTERLCSALGVEAVLLVPTCTMANQIALRMALPKGGVLVSAGLAHIVTVEARATGLTGVESHALPGEMGHIAPADIANFLRDRDREKPSLVWLENTHMLSSGTVMPDGWQPAIGELCHSEGVSVHLDGSRLWNAAVAQDVPMATLTAGADTISISLNKAVGAPLGSVLAGSRAAIEEATDWRDAMGGEWRPIGLIAAAALAALDGWRDRLAADMKTTHALAEAIASLLGDTAVQPAPTNLIFVNRPEGDGSQFIERLAQGGVRATMLIPQVVRLAIHGGVRLQDVDRLAAIVAAAHDSGARSDAA